MNISPVSLTSFTNLSMHNYKKGLKLIDDIGYPTTKGYYTIHPVEYEDFVDIAFENGESEIPDSHEEVTINKKYMYVSEMFTLPQARKLGMGNTLHLLNVVEMLENDIPLIDLDATAEAVPYHAKFGFRSDETWFNGLKATLNYIAEADTSFVKEIEELKKSKLSQKEKEIVGNSIVDKYLKQEIKKHSSDELKYLIPSYLRMVLKKEDVLNNKEFYNDLFKKHNIDYCID